MAGGKLTPRQKMINLMYLVFIAMMALNMSKEVLSAFGLMNERLVDSNESTTVRNQMFLDNLKEKAEQNAKQYGELLDKAQKIENLSSGLYQYIEDIKIEMMADVKDPTDYEVMDKSMYLDNKFFKGGDHYTTEGQEFVDKINNFRTEIITLLGESFKDVQTIVNKKFSTGDNGKIKDREGKNRDWLEYHYKGFPMVASLTKLTQIQSDIKTVQGDILSAMLQGNLETQVSMSNYRAIAVFEKGAFYQGETVKGRVVLGRYDDKTIPNQVIINGQKAEIINGQAVFSFGAGSVGEQKITGEFQFMEGDSIVRVPIEDKYVVVPRPNEATISADKMNSIYRGVDNPMTVSFAGISSNNVKASATGLRDLGGGKYIWRPDAIQGTEAKINVVATADGQNFPSSKTFIVRNIPAPVATLRGRTGTHKGNKNDLQNSTIAVAFPDFVFDIKVNVTQFEVSVPGSPRIICQGSKFNAQAIAAINRAKVGDVVAIANVKTTIPGSPVIIKDSAPFLWEIQ